MKTFFNRVNPKGQGESKKRYRCIINKTVERKFFFLLTVMMLLVGVLYKIGAI